MKIRSLAVLICLFVAFGSSLSMASAEKAAPPKLTDCEMRFSLKGWSAFYKTAKGEGKITCDNGQAANVSIKVTAGGLTFGKSEILNAKGEFSFVTGMPSPGTQKKRSLRKNP